MFEDLFNAFSNFRRNKTRTILSLLGIIIGVASVIVITTLGKSSSDSVRASFGSIGLDIISIMNNGPKHIRARLLSYNEAFREKLYALPYVQNVFFTNTFPATITRGNITVSMEALCTEYGYSNAHGYKIQNGSDFSVTDHVLGTQKMILGDKVAEVLFPDGNPVGRRVILSRNSVLFGFDIIGIFAAPGGMDETLSTTIMVPRGFYIKKMAPNPDADTIQIKAADADMVATVETEIKQLVEKETGSENVVWITSPLTMIAQINAAYAEISIMLSAVAGISLLVGGIGIMNIMIVTVTERKKEIGIRKALGATPKDIRNQFLVESAAITLAGGSIGILLGIAISAVIIYARNLPFTIQWQACVISFAFSVCVGIFFGLNPAVRAARLDPVDALASE